MHRYFSVLVLVLVFGPGRAQALSEVQRDSVRRVIDKIAEDDQKYRWNISFAELDNRKVDSLKALPDSVQWIRIMKVRKGQIALTQKSKDSLWMLQKQLDSVNREIFLVIVRRYGYPSHKRIGFYQYGSFASTLVLHLIGPKNFEELLPLFKTELAKGNMPPHDYAAWYDRCQLTMDKKKLYGEYMSEYPCVEDLKKTNIERRKIGLEELKNNNCK